MQHENVSLTVPCTLMRAMHLRRAISLVARWTWSQALCPSAGMAPTWAWHISCCSTCRKLSCSMAFIDSVHTQGDVIGCTLNMESGSLSFSRNGTDLGEAYQLPQRTK